VAKYINKAYVCTTQTSLCKQEGHAHGITRCTMVMKQPK